MTKSENGDQNKSHDNSRAVNTVGSGRIDATMNDTYGFKIGLENLQSVKADVQVLGIFAALRAVRNLNNIFN